MVSLAFNKFINESYFDFKYIIIFINKDFLLRILLNINIKLILTKLNIKELINNRYILFESAIILIYILEINIKTIFVKRKINFIYNFLVNILVYKNTINLEELFRYYRRDAKIIGFWNGIKVLVIIILKGENVLITIYLVKDIIISL